MKDRKAFVAEIISAEEGMSQLEISRAVKDQFGSGLSFVQVRRLRDAHEAGAFDRVWDELFAVEEAKSENGGRRKKPRGDRRRKTLLRGRRNLDMDKFVLNTMHNHLVIYRAEGGALNSQAFKSRERAEKLVKQLLQEGHPPEQIGYFRRNEVSKAA
ncbi:MAG: hypothetical protein H6839_05810 [Planctomycetes bacterium]|nr:hypothetical protein [Planctomycetota bacterium]